MRRTEAEAPARPPCKACDMSKARVHLITALPGTGKTTAIKSLASALEPGAFSGFYTQEMRVSGTRTGFKAVTFEGREVILAHVSFKSGPRVGKYRVDVSGFEEAAVPEIDPRLVDRRLFVIDEIGKMECESGYFVECVMEILERGMDLVATVALRGGGLIDKVKRRPEVVTHKLDRDNRDRLPLAIAAALKRYRR